MFGEIGTRDQGTNLTAGYCQYLLSSQINYTLTNFADHKEGISHDIINRHLGKEKITPKIVWENVKDKIVVSENGCILFDDSVMNKRYSNKIELVRRQYSGNEHSVVKGIGVVNCVYVNPDTEQFWVIDFRIYDPDGDGKTKLKHVEEMLNNIVFQKKLPFKTVLMDSWYAEKNIMLMVDGFHKDFYCPLKKNRLVDDSGGVDEYKNIEKLEWSEIEAKEGKLIKIKKFPKDHKVKLFRVIVSPDKTEYVATNDISQCSTDATKDKCGIRWKIEEFHRELKQIIGIEKCECRKQRIQRNHIACCMLVWINLKDCAYKCKTTIYRLKNGLLDNYLTKELKRPTISINLA